MQIPMNLISMWQDPGNGHAFYQCQHRITKYHLLGAGLSDLLLTESLFSLSKLCDYKEGRRGRVGMGGVGSDTCPAGPSPLSPQFVR